MHQPCVLLEQLLQADRAAILGTAKIAGLICIPVLYNIHMTPPLDFGCGKPNLSKEVSLVY
jgi:hypothetical protein